MTASAVIKKKTSSILRLEFSCVTSIYRQWKDFRKADLKTTYSKSHKNEVFKYNLITSSYQSSQRDLFQLFILFRWSDREILRNWISNLATKISFTNKKTRKSTDVKKKKTYKKIFFITSEQANKCPVV